MTFRKAKKILRKMAGKDGLYFITCQHLSKDLYSVGTDNISSWNFYSLKSAMDNLTLKYIDARRNPNGNKS